MMTTAYQVTGMTCDHCVHAVTEEFLNIDGVSEVSVTLMPGGESTVTVASTAQLDHRTVEAALDEAGDYRLATA